LVLLDRFADSESLLSEIETLYTMWHILKTERDALQQQEKDIETREEFLKYQLKELDELHLVEHEVETIDQAHREASHVDTLVQEGQRALEILRESEQSAILSSLHQAQQAVSAILSLTPQLKNTASLLAQAEIYVGEAAGEIQHFVEHLESDPIKLASLEERLAKIHHLAHKHRVKPEALLELQKSLHEEFDRLTHRDEHLQALEEKLQKIENDFGVVAEKLSAKRLKAALKFEKQMTEYLQLLGMVQGKLKIEFEKEIEKTPHPLGFDRIIFMVSINPGQPWQPLAKVASGGELSRISLAIQVITAEKNHTPSLIFDEADVGIGGGIAEIVGKLLRELGETTQTFCITHLPQVAACGHHQLAVLKQVLKQETFVQVKHLSASERVREVARMLGGVEVTDHALAHAQEMLI
jgi:DNA repair protein RecN (Recombination protein N)